MKLIRESLPVELYHKNRTDISQVLPFSIVLVILVANHRSAAGFPETEMRHANLGRCPLMAQSRHSDLCGFMSAFGGKADIQDKMCGKLLGCDMLDMLTLNQRVRGSSPRAPTSLFKPFLTHSHGLMKLR